MSTMEPRPRSAWRDGALARLVSAVAEPLFGTDRYEAWILRDWWPRYLAVAALLAAIILCRRPDVVSRPQFWAEDGSIYFCDALMMGFPRAVFRLYRGFPHLGQRLIAAFGSLFPIAAAPRVYTTAAIVTEALSVATFSLPRFRHLVRRDALRVLFCVACVSLPADVEVFATPTNVGWFVGLWLLFASLSTAPRGTASFIGLTACGITAIASTPLAALLVPLWLLRSLNGGVCSDRREVLFGSTLLFGFGIFLFTTRGFGADNPIALNIPGYDTPLVVSFHWANLFVATSEIVMARVVPHGMLGDLAASGSYAFHLGTFVVLGVLLTTAAVEGQGRLVVSLCGLALLIGSLGLLLVARPMVNLLMEIPDFRQHLPGRYAVFPVACMILCLTVVLDGIAARRARTLATLAACVLVTFAWRPTFGIAPLPDFDWPRWAARLQAKLDAQNREPLIIPIQAPLPGRIAIDVPTSSGLPEAGDRCAGSTYHDADTGAAGAR